jgi:hypothetical protein
MDQMPILEKTIELLDNCDLSLPELADMSGVHYEWLKRFKRGEIPNPGVKHIQRLHDFLAQRAEA